MGRIVPNAMLIWAKVRLGLAVPMSGSIGIFGRQVAKAVEIAVRELNAAGGLLGVPVELVVGDDRCRRGHGCHSRYASHQAG